MPEKLSIVVEQCAWPLNALQRKVRLELLDACNSGEILLERAMGCSIGNHSSSTVSLEDRFGLSFAAKCCSHCGLVYTDPIISEDSLPLYYEKYYHSLHFGSDNTEDMESLTSMDQGKTVGEFLLPFLKETRKSSLNIAEVGSAWGYVLSGLKDVLRDSGIESEVIGCEYSKNLVERANRSAIPTLHGGIDALVERGGSYDLIVLSHVFEHFTDLNYAASKLSGLLNKEGFLYVEVPGILDLKNKFDYDLSFDMYFTHAHMYHFSLNTLRNTLAPWFSLLYGDEIIRAVFLNNPAEGEFLNEYRQTVSYLADLNRNRDYYMSMKLGTKHDNSFTGRLKQTAVDIFNRLR